MENPTFRVPGQLGAPDGLSAFEAVATEPIAVAPDDIQLPGKLAGVTAVSRLAPWQALAEGARAWIYPNEVIDGCSFGLRCLLQVNAVSDSLDIRESVQPPQLTEVRNPKRVHGVLALMSGGDHHQVIVEDQSEQEPSETPLRRDRAAPAVEAREFLPVVFSRRLDDDVLGGMPPNPLAFGRLHLLS